MQTLKNGMTSLSLIANLNWDRVLGLGITGLALFVAAYMVSIG